MAHTYTLIIRPEGIMLQKSSLFYSKFPKKPFIMLIIIPFMLLIMSLFCFLVARIIKFTKLLKQYNSQCYSYACSANRSYITTSVRITFCQYKGHLGKLCRYIRMLNHQIYSFQVFSFLLSVLWLKCEAVSVMSS